MHLLVDSENVGNTWITELVPMLKDTNVSICVTVFYTDKSPKLTYEQANCFAALANDETHSITAMSVTKFGDNSLDFALSTYLGYIILANYDTRFYILSQDKGYESAIEMARNIAKLNGRHCMVDSIPSVSAIADLFKKVSNGGRPIKVTLEKVNDGNVDKVYYSDDYVDEKFNDYFYDISSTMHAQVVNDKSYMSKRVFVVLYEAFYSQFVESSIHGMTEGIAKILSCEIVYGLEMYKSTIAISKKTSMTTYIHNHIVATINEIFEPISASECYKLIKPVLKKFDEIIGLINV